MVAEDGVGAAAPELFAAPLLVGADGAGMAPERRARRQVRLVRGDALLQVLRLKESVGVLEGGVRLDEVLGALDELVILGRMVEGVAGLERALVVRFPIVTQRRLGFAMEEGVRGGHRSGHVVVVLALDVDDVEEVALAARYVVSPRPLQGA